MATSKRQANRASPAGDLQELRRRVTAFCREKGYRLSPNAGAILKDIVAMKQRAGDFYCTCQPQQSPETVCVCQPVRNGLVRVLGACFCGLILDKEAQEE